MLDYPFIQTGPWVKVGTGTDSRFGAWSYSLAPTNRGANDSFALGDNGGGGGGSIDPLPIEEGSFSGVGYGSGIRLEGDAYPVVMTGLVSDQAERVVFVPNGEPGIEGQIFQVPPDLVARAKAFVIIRPEITGPVDGRLIAYDGSGAEIASQQLWDVASDVST
jgi:hypothetical protein